MLKKKNVIKRRWNKKLFFPLLGAGLVCVFVAAFFFLTHNVSLGEFVFHPHSTYITGVSDEEPVPEEISVNDKYVTPKTKEGHPDGVLDTGKYPTIPETDGGKKNKGTEENPFVILEIVPEMAQQSLAYMVENQEEGLPYDPITVGIRISNNMLKSYSDKTSRTAIESMNQQFCMVNHSSEYFPLYKDGVKTGELKVPQDKGPNTLLNPNRNSDYMEQNQNSLPGWFANKITTDIYDPEGTIQGDPDKATNPAKEEDRATVRNKYARLDKYYEVKTTSDVLSLEDYAEKTVAELNTLHPDLFVDEGEAIRSDVVADEVNWNKNIELKKDIHYSFQTTSLVMKPEDYSGKTMAELVATESYKDVFATSDAKDIPEEVLSDEARWVKKEETKSDEIKEEIDKNKYLVFVPMGEGDYYTNGGYYYGAKLYKALTQEEKAKANICYVDDLSEYDEYTSVLDHYQTWQLSDIFVPDRISELEGTYIKASNIQGLTEVISYDTYQQYTFTYDYVLYQYTYTYYNIRVNDLVKRMFFRRNTDQEYEDIKLKVIVATPDMLNEVDKNDTTTKLSYIERADMVYFSAVDEEARAYNWDDFLKFYYEYVIEDPDAYDSENLATFFDNDLEWLDCMKLIERLSTEMNLPLMFTKQVGDMLNKGVNQDGSSASHIYLNASKKVKEEVSSINNIAKLYLITSQFNLGAVKGTKNTQGEIFERTFMDDIFPYIKQVPIVQKNGNTAKYTGYFERQTCDCGDLTDKQELNAHYLWNRYTFIPIDCEFNNNDSNPMYMEKYGYLNSYLKNNNNLQNGNTKMYNKVTGVRADHDFDNDPQNVTMVGRDIASTLETIFNDSTMGTMGYIIYKIMNQGTPETPTMLFSVEKYSSGDGLKLKYTKIDNTSVLLDYTTDAKYKNDKTLYLKCKLINNTYLEDGSIQSNIQDGVIQSVKLVNQDSGDAIELVHVSGDPKTVLASDYTKVENGFTPSVPFDISSVKFKEEDPSNPILELDADQGPIKGIQVPAEKSVTFWVPFQLYEWQAGYNKVEVTWVARTSKGRNGYQNEGTNEVTIGERTLFNLE